jgi:beta-glucanase (GH16 family)
MIDNLQLGAIIFSQCVLFVGLIAGFSAPDTPYRAEVDTGNRLILDHYELTFDEPFNYLDVSPWGPNTRWITHTPWNGDFGDAKFSDPGFDEPFKILDGVLQIEMRKRGNRWKSGLLSSSDRLSRGFLQSGGYFEIRAKLPGGPGVWPAFWLGSNAKGEKPNPEIDVVEYYGRFPDCYRATTHIWKQAHSLSGNSYKISVPRSSLENSFHTYGVSINERSVIFYLDRREVARELSKPEYLQPMFLMVDLGAGGGWPIDGMRNPSIMYVDYIRAYRSKGLTQTVPNNIRQPAAGI